MMNKTGCWLLKPTVRKLSRITDCALGVSI